MTTHDIIKEFTGESMESKFKTNDRVRRIPFTVTVAKQQPADNGEIETDSYSQQGCMGTVKEIREETTLAKQESRTESLMFLVQWDNGTLSYHGPNGLEAA
jgi:hypothetical protein